jgi:hypothetical protein
MKKFLLIAGYSYYPDRGTGDWIGCYSSYEEANELVKFEEIDEYFLRGPRKGQTKETRQKLFVNGLERDWYEIVDLDEWMNK